MKAVYLLICLALPCFITGSIISKPRYYMDTKNSFKNINHYPWQSLEAMQQSAQQSSEQSSQQSSQEWVENSQEAQAWLQNILSTQQQQGDQRLQQKREQQQYEQQYYQHKKYQPVQRKLASSSERNSQETREQFDSYQVVYRVPAENLNTWQVLVQNIMPNKGISQEMREVISSYNSSKDSRESTESLVNKNSQRKHFSSSPIEENLKQSISQETNERISRESIESNINTQKRVKSLYSNSRKAHPSADDNQKFWNGEDKKSVVPVKSKRDIAKIYMTAYETMKSLSSEHKKQFHDQFKDAARTDNEDVYLNATQLLKKNQYLAEEHTVKTEDGYFLTLFRVAPQHEIRGMQNRPVIFLMHGLLGSADDWLLMGPGKSLAYLLSDAGYDVWLGNARGNKYARHHASKHPSQHDFWHFTTDEIALQDLPTMIDYVLETSKQRKLYYVAHSQGTTAFFALAASRPAYNEKIIMMFALSPMVYMSNVRSPLFRMIAPNSQFYSSMVQNMGRGEFQPSQKLIRAVGGDICEKKVGCEYVCSNIYFVMSGVNADNLDMGTIPVIMGHLPAGASIKQIKQYGQAVDSQEFMKYDYGSEINEVIYGNPQPPRYKMEKVSTPVALYYSEDDWLSHPKDVMRLQGELPNVRDAFKVPEENHFSSMDFQFSKQAPEVVYQRLIKSIQKQESS